MSQMYGPRRVILKKANARGHQWVVYAGKVKPERGGSYHPMGVWYEDAGRFYADLKTEEQEYQALKVVELGIKRFGGTASKAELRDLLAVRMAKRDAEITARWEAPTCVR